MNRKALALEIFMLVIATGLAVCGIGCLREHSYFIGTCAIVQAICTGADHAIRLHGMCKTNQ